MTVADPFLSYQQFVEPAEVSVERLIERVRMGDPQGCVYEASDEVISAALGWLSGQWLAAEQTSCTPADWLMPAMDHLRQE